MTFAWVAVPVLLVGLPLAAVWWSRRATWSRLRPGREHDLFGEVMREHGLGPAGMARVESAVWRGRELTDPRERAAVVRLAGAQLPRELTGRRRVLGVVAAGGGGCLLVAAAVWATVQGRWGDVWWWGLCWLVPVGWSARNARRAVRLNRD